MKSNNIFQVLWASLTAKITPIFTKIKLWTSWSFIRTRVVARIRGFFSRIFNVRPRDKKDYYEIFGWLVSKRLAFAIAVVITTLSLIYLVNLNLIRGTSTSGTEIKKYSYDSLLLRFAEGRIQITGEGGYLAFEGDVEKGYVAGNGQLYNRAGVMVYQGQFEKNCYEGTGTQYYDDGVMHYQGQFSNNLYQGTGKLYRDNGSLWYNGEFSQGMMEGEGVLYDGGNNVIFQGNFTKDQIVYSDFLGKTTAEASKAYTGKRDLYEDDENFVVVMKDIDAVYAGTQDANALDGAIKVGTVYVLRDSFPVGTEKFSTIEELKSYFGSENYDGKSLITMPEAVCYSQLSGGMSTDVVTERIYDDYYRVTDYDGEKEVVLYSFEKNGLVYTFVGQDQQGTFSYYSITEAEGGA